MPRGVYRASAAARGRDGAAQAGRPDDPERHVLASGHGRHGGICPSATGGGRRSAAAAGAGERPGASRRGPRRCSARWRRATACGPGALDGPCVQAHRVAAGASSKTPGGGPADHAPGRSRGGWDSHLLLLSDGDGLPLAAEPAAGQASEPPASRPSWTAGLRIGMHNRRVAFTEVATQTWRARTGSSTKACAGSCRRDRSRLEGRTNRAMRAIRASGTPSIRLRAGARPT